MTILARDYESANNASADERISRSSFDELKHERDRFVLVRDQIEVVMNTLRNTGGLIVSDDGEDMRLWLLDMLDDARSEAMGHIEKISEAM